MILWTIQHIEAYNKMKEMGFLRTYSNHIFMELDPRPYLWMANQLERKNSKPDRSIQYPVWAWFMWEGKHKRRDLRCSGYGRRGDDMVQLTIEVPEEQILLSDFDAFHFVLNDFYLPYSEEDDLLFEKNLEMEGLNWVDILHENVDNETKKKHREKVVNSWNRIFDLESEDGDYWCDKTRRSIQAVMWQITAEQILKVEYFKAK